MNNYIGIDPDCDSSGVTIIYCDYTIQSLSFKFPNLIETIKKEFLPINTSIAVEAGWLNKKSNFRPNFGKKVNVIHHIKRLRIHTKVHNVLATVFQQKLEQTMKQVKKLWRC